MRLLVAATNEPLARAIRGTLLGAHHDVEQTATHADTLAELGQSEPQYDAIVLDEDMVEPPDGSFIASLRKAAPDIKILLLTSTPLSRTTGAGNRWRALPDEYEPLANHPADPNDSDAPRTDQSHLNQPDAVLRKPFSDTELLSHVEALTPGSPTMIIRGNLTLDTTNRKAYYASTHTPINLSRLEYSLLEALVRANGEFVDIKRLAELVSGPYFEQQGLLHYALYTLNKKLTRAGLIMTRRDSSWRIR